MVTPMISRTVFQDHCQGVAAIGRVGLRASARRWMVGIGAVGPGIGMGPDAELEIDAAPRRLLGDEAQGIPVLFPLAHRQQRLDPHLIIAGHGDQIGIGKMQIVAGDPGGKVIGQPKRQGEAVEAAGRQQIEIARPEIAVIEPGLVMAFVAEQAGDAGVRVAGAASATRATASAPRGLALNFTCSASSRSA